MQEYKQRGVEMLIPSTGSDWQLYTCSMKCGTAARSLTAALKQSFKNFDQFLRQGKTFNESINLARKEFQKVQSKYASYGAFDTEPNQEFVIQFIKYIELKHRTKLDFWDVY